MKQRKKSGRNRRNYSLIIGGVLTGVLLVIILIGTVWQPYDPNAMSASEKLLAPSWQHWFGTDNFGRDIFSRVLEGARTTLFIGVCTVAIGAVCGIIVGSLTGYFGGWLDEVLMRFNDSIAAFPSILLALVFISLLGTGKYKIILTLGILFVPSFARIVRGEFARERGRDYVQNARIMGASNARILFAHILPNIRSVLLSAIAIGFNNSVLAEASMSYLGMGVLPPDASLGRMLSESQTYLFTAPWYAISTGVFIILLILGFSLLGQGWQERGHH
jgi:peptide/nickel transport system permease protein